MYVTDDSGWMWLMALISSYFPDVNDIHLVCDGQLGWLLQLSALLDFSLHYQLYPDYSNNFHMFLTFLLLLACLYLIAACSLFYSSFQECFIYCGISYLITIFIQREGIIKTDCMLIKMWVQPESAYEWCVCLTE